MKKLLFIFFTLIAFTNISYSSFPVTENQQTEVVEVITSNSTQLAIEEGSLNIYAIASILLLVLALVFVFKIVSGIATLGAYGAGSGPTIANYISYTIYSVIAAIVLGIIAFVKSVKKKKS